MRARPRKTAVPMDVDPYTDDEIKAIEKEEKRERITERRDLKVKDRMLTLRTRVQEKEKKLKEGESASQPKPYTVDDAIKLTSLPDEQQGKIMETMQRLNLMDAMRSGKGSEGAMMQSLMAWSMQNPRGSQVDMMKFATSLVDSLQTGLKMGVDLAGRSGEGSPTFKDGMEYSKAFYDRLMAADSSTGTKDVFLAYLLEQVKNKPKPFDTLGEIAKTAESLGYVKGGSTEKVALMRLDWDKQNQQEERRFKIEVKKMEAIAGAVNVLAENLNVKEAIAAGISRGLLGMRGGPQPPHPAQAVPQAMSIKCKECGHVFDVVKGAVGIVECPSCKVELDLGTLS